MNTINDILKTEQKLPVAKEASLSVVCTYNFLNQNYQELFKSYDLSEQQYNVLRILRGQNGLPANLSTLQERMLNKMSNTTRLVEKLRIKGFVTREVCKENRRKIEISITQKGLDMLDLLDPILMALENRLISKISIEEAHQLVSILEKIRS